MKNNNPSPAISDVVLELTLSSGFATDLDALLDKLLAILGRSPGFPFTQQGAILLRNPRNAYFQVAQCGIAPPWISGYRWEQGVFAETALSATCRFVDQPTPFGGGAPGTSRLALLPLHMQSGITGYAVLFAQAGYVADEPAMKLLSDLARVISSLVSRTLTIETLQVREVELEDARANAIRSLGVASEYRDNETGWHVMRMTNVAQAIAKAMGVPEQLRELLYIAAPMHDVGKIGIADAILRKPGKLSAEEFEIMKTHTTIGVTILTGNDPLIAAAREIAGNHHEHWDGTGYPRGLREEDIPLLARICSVADVFDALTSVRPYKQPWPTDEAAAWITAQSGTHFDPSVVEAFQRALPEILRIRELYRDDIIDPNQSLALPPIEHGQDRWVAWDDSLSVGIDTIDEHHRYLLDLINELHDVIINKRGARSTARVIKALDAYARVHFRAEEMMMAHYEFAEIEHQEEQHHAFEQRVQDFYHELHINPLVAQFDILQYLRAWLIGHIRVDDAQLRSLVTR